MAYNPDSLISISPQHCSTQPERFVRPAAVATYRAHVVTHQRPLQTECDQPEDSAMQRASTPRQPLMVQPEDETAAERSNDMDAGAGQQHWQLSGAKQPAWAEDYRGSSSNNNNTQPEDPVLAASDAANTHQLHMPIGFRGSVCSSHGPATGVAAANGAPVSASRDSDSNSSYSLNSSQSSALVETPLNGDSGENSSGSSSGVIMKAYHALRLTRFGAEHMQRLQQQGHIPSGQEHQRQVCVSDRATVQPSDKPRLAKTCG